MKIIILGAGRIGESVAGTLVSESNDITVIDTDAARLRELEERFELRGVVGSGIEPDVLAEAGARDCDMLIACAAQDETNLVCCKVAYQVFGIPTRIARVRSSAYKEDSPLLGKDGFAVDCVICPEESLTRYIGKLVEYPEALQVREFANGLACLVAVRAVAGAPLVRHSIAELRERVPGADMRIVAHLPPARQRARPLHRLRRPDPGRTRRRGLRAVGTRAPAGAVGAAPRRPGQTARRRTHHDRGRRPAGCGSRGCWSRPAAPTRSRCWSTTTRAACSRPPNCRAACWCCTATAPTRTCWKTKASRASTCSSRSPAMTRTTSWPACWPSAWERAACWR